MSTLNFHDAKSGKWFRYDSRCAACYLNHEHSHADHCKALAGARAQEVAATAPDWRDTGYWQRVEEIGNLTRALLPTVTADTPLLNGAWE
jgi:hypothetical protein